jgi:hypothetical protein
MENVLHSGGFMIYFLLIFVVMIFVVLLCSDYENRHFKVKKYVFRHAAVKKKQRIVYLSDLHENCFGKENEKLTAAIREMKPDVILLGGDLIIGKGNRVETDHALAFLKGLSGLCPVYYCYGNHETRVKHTQAFQKYEREVKKLSVTILNNKHVHLPLDGADFEIYGLDLENDYYRKKKIFHARRKIFYGQESSAHTSSTQGARVKILLAHSPNFFEEYVKWRPDFIFSGHNHGGIVRMPGGRGVIATDGLLFPKYSYGLYQKEDSTMILSAGAGTHTIKFRLNNSSEFVVADILPVETASRRE